MAYLYETHLHTSQGSRCGSSTGREQARFYHDRGYQGIIVTDHFFGGNTAAPRDGSWKDRISRFCEGYVDAWNEGQRIGLDVFFGWEQTFEGDDYLVYGLDMQWLLEHPEMEHWNRREQLAGVHAAGGCVVQAHPFRCRDYLSRVLLGLDYADAVEVANAGNEPLHDYYARLYAETHHLMMTSGSDNHRAQDGAPLMGVSLKRKLRSIRDWVRIIRKGEPVELHVPFSRFAMPLNTELPLSCYLLDEHEDKVRYRQRWLHDVE